MKLYKSKNYLVKQIQTKTYSQIAKENGVNKSTIQRNLKKLGLTKPIKKWTITELNILKKNYSTDRALLSKLKNRSLSSIYHKASRLKIHRDVKPLKYKIDQNFFNVWSKELAYFLGFFIADGHISLKSRTISIKIQKRDAYILSKFLRLIKSNRPIKYEGGYPSLKVSNNLIIKRLIKLGCKPGDSINNSYPKTMPTKYFFHFLRGYIDGDGSIYICKSKKSRQKNVLRVTILGSREFLQTLIKKISFYLEKRIEYTIIGNSHSKSLYRVTFNGQLARRLCYEIYKNCGDLYIKRKRKKFEIHVKQLIKNA